jgi:hypothetical protein
MPNVDRAVIAPEKLRDYLLNPQHRRGGTKARVLLGMGFQADDWGRLESELRVRHLSAEAVAITDGEYGRRYEILAPW